MYVVLIETSGNQNYIFATNKLRENVGASELTYQVGTRLVLAAVERQYDYPNDRDGNALRKILLAEEPIENSKDEDSVEIIIATSGKALLLTRSRNQAEEIVREVTKQALIEMPGLAVHGAIETIDANLLDIHIAISKVHRKLETLRYSIPSKQQRFPRLPWVEPCSTSGLPASEIVKFRNPRGEDAYAFSKMTTSKRMVLAKDNQRISNNDDFDKGRIANLLETVFDLSEALPKNLEELENVFSDLKWLAVIHADGNGLGEIFLNFADYLNVERNTDAERTFKTIADARRYIKAYRHFSIALDICTINAAGYALKSLQIEAARNKEAQGEVPVIPLVLGGDDLTVLCDGQYAIKFTKDFLSQFERETENINNTVELKDLGKVERFKPIVEKLKIEDEGQLKDIVSFIANKAFSIRHLGICAGVTIVKPHYPFHQAYDLAEQLLKSAKDVKKKVLQSDGRQLPCCAMDFHVLYDSAHSELEEIHNKLTIREQGDKKTFLSAKPYIVSQLDVTEIQATIGEETEANRDWFRNRTFNQLQNRIEAMTKPSADDDSRRALPNGKLHEIRQSLFRGKDVADAEATLVRNRLSTSKKSPSNESARELFENLILISGTTLFFDDSEKNSTHFLDAIETVQFWRGCDLGRKCT
jgi:hypothetical protein